MKIDIITLHAVKNYGSVLQALATQELFKEAGFEVTIIDYVKEESKNENLMRFWGGRNPLKCLIVAPTLKRWKKVFDGFCREHLNLTSIQYTTEEDFKDYILDADVYCTGSDQVWNSVWNNGLLKPLYLSFVPSDRCKIAFSASFGQQRLSQEEIDATRSLINEYRMITVREESAVSILKEQYGYEKVEQILDPTLCFSGEFWRQYESKRKRSKDYILVYNLNRSREFDRYAMELSHRMGIELVRLCTRYDQFYRPGKSVLVPEIDHFIRLIDDAKVVITDSFHATAFAMNMNTEPICVLPNKFGGRIESFLSLTQSSQRIIKSYKDFDVINRHVDFSAVNNILDNERAKARLFVERVRSEIQ